jgi:hypothetical protein
MVSAAYIRTVGRIVEKDSGMAELSGPRERGHGDAPRRASEPFFIFCSGVCREPKVSGDND